MLSEGSQLPLVLASTSPRRKQLLQLIDIPFSVIESHVDESVAPGLPAEIVVQHLAERKARKVAEQLGLGNVVIGADTIVVLNGMIMGKPRNERDAYTMLHALQGRIHEVYTGVTIMASDMSVHVSQVCKTQVKMRSISPEMIKKYVASGEPLDKAGAYAIQGHGAVFIESIHGCYYNVVGLPLALLVTMLKKFGYDLV